MGLFDRPAPGDAIQSLRKPAIGGLTSALKSLRDAEWSDAVENLREAGLLLPATADDPGALDCHPLVREYFGDRLRQTKRAAWTEGHSRLFDYYCGLPKTPPVTLEEMVPLYTAIPHGCAAERQSDALTTVYRHRIHRGQRHYGVEELGAFGADLAAVSAFFEERWASVSRRLSRDDQAFVLHACSYDLTALGRTAEAEQPMQACLELRRADRNWAGATLIAVNLSQHYLSTGQLHEARKQATDSVEFGKLSGDWREECTSMVALARVIHQAGDYDAAAKVYRQAEELQKSRQPELAYLYSLRGLHFCDLLLSQKHYREAAIRAEHHLRMAQSLGRLLDCAIGHLLLGRARMLEFPPSDAGGLAGALEDVNQAVDGIRTAGTADEMPRGFLARAEIYRHMRHFSAAQADMAEAERICKRCGLRLLEVDCHLEYARFYLAQGERDEARERLETARGMIGEMGYHRRDRDVTEVQAALDAETSSA